MPWAYQRANPDGRPYCDDLGLMTKNPVLRALQPWQFIPRVWKAYRAPLPFKQTAGASEKRFVLWDQSYPAILSDDADFVLKLERRPVGLDTGETYSLLHAEIDVAVGDGWSRFAVWADYVGWVNCFWQYRKTFKNGKRLAFYIGFKQDTTVVPNRDGSIKSDMMCWWPEISLTYL